MLAYICANELIKGIREYLEVDSPGNARTKYGAIYLRYDCTAQTTFIMNGNKENGHETV